MVLSQKCKKLEHDILKLTCTFQRTVILCWCLGSACNVSVLFGLYERYISVLATAFYVGLSRTVWAIGLAWILIACYTKHGGKIV